MGITASMPLSKRRLSKVVRNYCFKLADIPVGGGRLTLETIHFRGHDWSVEVNKVGFYLEGSVGVHVRPVVVPKHNNEVTLASSRCMDEEEEKYYDERETMMENVKISIQILGKSGEYTLFNNHYRFCPILVVSRRKLEEQSCVRKGSLKIRVTLSSQEYVAPLTRCMLTTTRLFTVTGYSKLITRMPPGSDLTLETFQLRGQSWCVKLRLPFLDPRSRSEDHFAVVVTRDLGLGSNSNSWELRNTRFSIQILDESGKYAVFHNKTAMKDMISFGMLVVFWRELEASSCIHNDSFTIRYTLFTEPEPLIPGAGVGSRNVIKPKKMLPSAAAAMVPPPTAGVGSASSSRLPPPPPPCSRPNKSPSPPICTPRCIPPFGIYRRVENEEVPTISAAAGDTTESDQQTPLLSAMYG